MCLLKTLFFTTGQHLKWKLSLKLDSKFISEGYFRKPVKTSPPPQVIHCSKWPVVKNDDFLKVQHQHCCRDLRQPGQDKYKPLVRYCFERICDVVIELSGRIVRQCCRISGGPILIYFGQIP